MIQAASLGTNLPLKIAESKPAAEAAPAKLMQSFQVHLQQALEQVNAQQVEVHKLNDTYLAGQVDVTQVLIAAEQAQLSLQFTAQVRNKVIEAYQDIMRMQV